MIRLQRIEILHIRQIEPQFENEHKQWSTFLPAVGVENYISCLVILYFRVYANKPPTSN